MFELSRAIGQVYGQPVGGSVNDDEYETPNRFFHQ